MDTGTQCRGYFWPPSSKYRLLGGICLTIGVIRHLRNISIVVVTALIKQNVRVHGDLVRQYIPFLHIYKMKKLLDNMF